MADEPTTGTATQDQEEDFVSAALADKGQQPNTPTPANPTPQAAPAQAPQQQSGDPELDYVSGIVKKDQQGSFTEKAKSFWDWTDKSLLVPQGSWEEAQLAHENAVGQQIINH